jgi:predicted DNA-binding transcriptional regulator AlpA
MEENSSILTNDTEVQAGSAVSWYVTVRLQIGPNASPPLVDLSDGRIQYLASALAPHAGIISAIRTDVVDVTIAITNTMDKALEKAVTLVYDAALKSGFDSIMVSRASMISDEDTFNALDEDRPPKFLSVSETARLLGVSRQMVSKMYKTGKLPNPVCHVGVSPGFARSDIERLLEKRENS